MVGEAGTRRLKFGDLVFQIRLRPLQALDLRQSSSRRAHSSRLRSSAVSRLSPRFAIDLSQPSRNNPHWMSKYNA